MYFYKYSQVLRLQFIPYLRLAEYPIGSRAGISYPYRVVHNTIVSARDAYKESPPSPFSGYFKTDLKPVLMVYD